MLYTVVVQWVEAAVAFYNTVGNGHAINSCNFYRIEGLTGRENIVKVLSALPVAAPPPPPSSIENAARLLHASTLFARFFSKKKNARRPVTNLSSAFIDRFAIILKLGTKKNVLFFFSLFLLESSTKGNMTGKEKRGGSGNKCEIGGGSVGIEASK